ncbi:hypothetical protein [Paenibacillus sp. KS-LC4]|uniref:hypothetical protein n=1 Tax=Paenibacillus sp. KS-LC4 TaxID=2979727 RepID=UPI0030CD2093
MKDSRYIVFGIILHVGWFLCGFYLLQYIGKASFMMIYDSWSGGLEGTEAVANRMYIFQILFVLYSFSLLYFHGRYFNRSKTAVKKKLLHLLFIMGVNILFTTGFLLWWNYAPPMSETKALKFAKVKMEEYSSELKFNSIRYDKYNNQWLVEYKYEDISDQCVRLEITREYDAINNVTCFSFQED